MIESLDHAELDQYLPPNGNQLQDQYNTVYGQSSVPCTTSSWSSNYQRINGGMTLASYSMAQSSDITSPYDLSNHPSPANSSQNMHSPSYQSSVINDCKFSDDDRNTTIKLEPARQRQNPRQFETYDVSPPPPRYSVEHTNYSSASPNPYPATTPSGSPTYQYLNVSRQIYNPAIPAAVPVDQQWNRYTWSSNNHMTFVNISLLHIFIIFVEKNILFCISFLIQVYFLWIWVWMNCNMNEGNFYKVEVSLLFITIKLFECEARCL
jgi:hypothetical protein